MHNFWKKLTAIRRTQGKPFFILAPMADVTDMAFRQIIVECGKPDVLYTEFVSADGLCSEKGRPKLMPHLAFKENERPIVAQIFGSNPQHFYEAAKLIARLCPVVDFPTATKSPKKFRKIHYGVCPVVNFSDAQSAMPEATEKSTTGFDGIDINMGCPAGKIVKHDSGAGLILNPELAKKIIHETKRGAGGLPVSVKTRIGYNKIITEEWMSHLIEAEPAAIILHGRTMKEMSKVPAHWDEIGKAAVLCRKAGIPIIGNGDVASYADGVKKAKQYGLDGIMVGRGVFSNPWFFSAGGGSAFGGNPVAKTPTEKIELLKKHVELFTELWVNPPAGGKHFDVMKKFFKIYISGWEGAKELRIKLMNTKNIPEVLTILTDSK